YVKRLGELPSRDELLGQFNEPKQINNQTIEFFRTEFPTGASMDYAFIKDMIENRGTAKVKVQNTNNTLMTIFL
ncbi:MAG TPA: hypothetical protein PKB10_01505, partial [Tepidisphaeraceae bacterium]|nr:hypothetical protein [Tepidisphaeraceae bacterium]